MGSRSKSKVDPRAALHRRLKCRKKGGAEVRATLQTEIHLVVVQRGGGYERRGGSLETKWELTMTM